jgi:hypothetical protein
LDAAASFLAGMQYIWDGDDGALWGVRLHAPLIFVAPETRHGVANMPDHMGILEKHGDVYVGVLPDDFRISGAPGVVDFQGFLWAVMPWGIEEYDFNDEASIYRVLAHEAFHVIQNQLISGSPQARRHLDKMSHSLDARISIMLELTALMAAARGSGDARIAAINDALSIRHDRRQHYPEAVAEENSFELMEGLAVFTDLTLVMQSIDEMVDVAERFIQAYYAETENLGSFGYFSGALYGLLLEEMGANWKRGLEYGTAGTDLGLLLQQHMGITELTPFASLDLEHYGHTEIARIQRAWTENMAESEIVELSVMGPTLRLSGDIYISRDEGETEFLFSPEIAERLEDYSGIAINGDLMLTGTGWQLELQGGYIALRPGYAKYVEVYSKNNIRVNEDGSRATGSGNFFRSTPEESAWELIITDDGYMVETFPNGLAIVVARLS